MEIVKVKYFEFFLQVATALLDLLEAGSKLFMHICCCKIPEAIKISLRTGEICLT